LSVAPTVDGGKHAGQGLQQQGIRAFAIGAVLGRGHRTQKTVGNAVAHPLATGLVVQPVHAQAGALHQVHQALFVCLVQAGATPAREQAGHRHLRAGAAGLDVGEVHQITLGAQRLQARRGRAGVTAQAKVRRARRLTHHHNHQRRTVMGGGRDAHAGIQAHGPQRLGGHGRLAQPLHHHAVNHVERVDHVAQGLVVAHERGDALESREQRDHKHCERHQHGGTALPPLVPHCHRPHGHAPPHDRRQHRTHEQRHGKVSAQQALRFQPVGVKHVGHHAGVDHDAVGEHEVAGHAGQQQQHNPQCAAPGTPHEGGQYGQERGAYHHGEREHDPQATGLLHVRAQVNRTPQRDVAHRGQPQRQQQFETDRVNAARARGWGSLHGAHALPGALSRA
jgi:hypothetical protein